MRKLFLIAVMTLLPFAYGRADDLNFQMVGKPVVTYSLPAQVKAPLTYDEAVKEATRTGKLIIITRDVEGDEEICKQAERDGNLYFNADGNTKFHVGLSKVKMIEGEPCYVEVPSCAFPEKPQGVQYRINWDRDRPVKSSAKVRVPTEVVEYVKQQTSPSTMGYYQMQDWLQQQGNCANGQCQQPQQYIQQQPMYSAPMMMPSQMYYGGGFSGGSSSGGS